MKHAEPYVPGDWIIAKVTFVQGDVLKSPHGPWCYAEVIKSRGDYISPGESVTFDFSDPTHPAHHNLRDPSVVAWTSDGVPKSGRVVVLGDHELNTGGYAVHYATLYRADFHGLIPGMTLTKEERLCLKERARQYKR